MKGTILILIVTLSLAAAVIAGILMATCNFKHKLEQINLVDATRVESVERGWL